MIDEPNKELDTPVMDDEDFELFYSKICDEFGDKPQSQEEYLKEMLSGEDEAAGAEAPEEQAGTAEKKQAAPVKKDHSIRNLTVLIVLEVLGILGVAAWWILRLL